MRVRLSTETQLVLVVVIAPVLGCFALFLVWRYF